MHVSAGTARAVPAQDHVGDQAGPVGLIEDADMTNTMPAA